MAQTALTRLRFRLANIARLNGDLTTSRTLIARAAAQRTNRPAVVGSAS